MLGLVTSGVFKKRIVALLLGNILGHRGCENTPFSSALLWGSGKAEVLKYKINVCILNSS